MSTAIDLPGVIPLFPLPNVVLFPRIPLPLHIFEPRYRAMTRDALAGNRLIGMVLLREPAPPVDAERPPIFAEGTVGEIMRHEALPDGRFNIVLRGLREYRIGQQWLRQPYREAEVTWRTPSGAVLADGVRAAIQERVDAYLRVRGATPMDHARFADVDDETMVNFLAQHLDLAAIDRQGLLEAPTLGERGARLCEVVAFRTEEIKTDSGSGQLH